MDATDATHAAVTFGRWLRQHRKNLDLTQEELAKRIGCSDIAIRKMEAGVRRPSRQVAELLADIFKVSDEERQAFIGFARGLDEQTRPPDPDTVAGRLPSSNLPAQLTRLIGREEIAASICSHLSQDDVRLLTLTGPPGIGKTSLAIHVAAGLLANFRDGVFFVALAAIVEPAMMTATIAKVFGLADSVHRSLGEALTERLRDKQILLVLDNFEQVLDASPVVLELLGAYPKLKVLVTSREALRVSGEQLFQVPTLQTADPVNLPSLQALQDIPAIALFLERARAVNPNFALTEQNAQAVASICARLQGVPLAIELAAARVNLLSPQEMQSRLDKCLSLLESTARHLPAKQRTLRGAIDWSYALLSETEKLLFTRLGVFAGGCTFAAAQAVCNALGDLPFDLLDGLASLIDKSLVKQEEALDESRYTMLETIREFALEQLKAGGQDGGQGGGEGALRRLHAEYFLALAGSADQAWAGPERPKWLRVIEIESENLRGAFSWALGEDAEIAGGLSSALWGYWYNLGHWHEGLSWATAVVDRGEALSPQTLARVLNAGGTLAWVMQDFPLAREYNEKSLSIARRQANKKQIAWSLRILGSVARDLGDYETASVHFAESLALSKEIDDTVNAAYLLISMGESARSQGQYGRALELYTESLELMRGNSDVGGIRICLFNMAHVQHNESNFEAAATLFREVLHITMGLGDKLSIAENMAGLGGIARARGDTIRAARIFAAVNSILDSTNQRFYSLDRKDYEGELAMVRRMLDEKSWEQAWAEGRAMTLEQAIAYALEE